MACPEFEDLVREGAGGHATRCEECRALLDALADVDAAFEAAFADVSAPPDMAAAVRARVARELPLRPSPLPEILDFIGWAAVLALAVVLLPRFLPLIDVALAGLG
jgi:predicted anti-sigma-YlaC factor YlaD